MSALIFNSNLSQKEDSKYEKLNNISLNNFSSFLLEYCPGIKYLRLRIPKINDEP